MNLFDKDTFLIYGEFKDKKLEEEFFESDMGKAMKYLKPMTLILALLYFSFLIPDYFVITDKHAFKLILINRLLFLSIAFIFYLTVSHMKSYKLVSLCLSILEAVAIIFLLQINLNYEHPNYLLQTFDVMVFILCVFLVPNKWTNMLAVSVLSCIDFLVPAYFYYDQTKHSIYIAGIVYIIIVLTISSIYSYRNGYLKRVQFLNTKELLRLATLDPLTGIYNRGRFNEELRNWFEYSKRYKLPLSLVMLDLDNFKHVNDTHGHPVGDKVLIATANLVKESIRHTDILARFGGEEFVILLPNTHITQAVELIERIRFKISNYHHETVGPVTSSFGIVELAS